MSFKKMIINIIIIIIINNRLFSTHTHVCEFITSKTSWYTKKYGMPNHHHMEDRIVINHKRQ
jgi:hypothetical protein